MPEPSDRLILSPHARFLAQHQTPQRAEYRAVMTRPDVQAAFIHAFAEMAARGATREQLDGAHIFINIFQNFSETPPKQSQYPVKALQSQLA